MDTSWKQVRQPHPHISKCICISTQKRPENEGPHDVTIPCPSVESRDFHRLLWHTNSDFYDIWADLLGMGAGLQEIDIGQTMVCPTVALAKALLKVWRLQWPFITCVADMPDLSDFGTSSTVLSALSTSANPPGCKLEPIFGKRMQRSTFQWKKGFFSEKGGGNSVNEGFGKDFYRKGNSVKRFGRFSEPPDSENWKVAVLIPFPKISS